MDGLGGAGTEKRAAAAEVRARGARFRAHGHIVDALALAARSLGGGRDQPLARRRRRDKFDGGARRDHGRAGRIACVGKGGVGQREQDSAVAHSVAVQHIAAHGHRHSRPPQPHFDQLDAERLRRVIARVERLGHPADCAGRIGRRFARRFRMVHAQRPSNAGWRFSVNAATPSA